MCSDRIDRIDRVDRVNHIDHIQRINRPERLHILIVGCGGREHAIAKALHKSKFKPKLFCFGTYRNPGIFSLVFAYGTGESITYEKDIIDFSLKAHIDFAIIGPETPLESGLVDSLYEHGIRCIGPYSNLARLETSKQYTRNLLNRYGLANFSPKWKSWDCNTHRGVIYNSDTPKNKIMTEVHYQELKSKNFSSIEQSIREFINQLNGNFVIKCDGLKSGKGVYVSGDHFQTSDQGVEICRKLYNNRDTFLIEERLEGEEFSLISFCDGKNFVHCPIVRDYKRASSDRNSPNTGGMGTVTNSNHRLPFLSPKDVKQAQKITETAVRGLMMDNDETPYIGIVYGGFMKLENTDINDQSIRVIEYNARFGDPEGINLLELLDTDFVQVCLDMLNENLSQDSVTFKELDTKCVYIVPKGYPNNKRPNFIINQQLLENIIRPQDRNVELIVNGINHTRDVKDKHPSHAHSGNVYIEQVKTIDSLDMTCKTLNVEKLEQQNIMTINDIEMNVESNTSVISDELVEVVVEGDDSPPVSGLMTTGSRTFALIGIGTSGIRQLDGILQMLRHHQDVIDRFSFRQDIGNGFVKEYNHSVGNRGLYASSGVNIETGNEAVSSIQHYVKDTHTHHVLPNEGGFGGMIAIPESNNISCDTPLPEWIMVNSTDSVGSKSIFVRRWWGKTRGMESLGHDIVNHCVNDILVQSPYVRPWTFLDYFATHTLDPVELKWFVKGVSSACKKVGCVLIGGETAEIPGIYRSGCHDLVGAITGFIDRTKILTPKSTLEAGDIVISIPSNSPHTNGFTLIQHLIRVSKNEGDSSYLRYVDDWAKPHRCYIDEVREIEKAGVSIKGLCHVTGGGFIDNPKRILPEDLDIDFDWVLIKNQMPEWMNWLRRKMREIDPNFQMEEVYRTFNCGIGMLVVIKPDDIELISKLMQDLDMKVVGTVCEKSKRVNISIRGGREREDSGIFLDFNKV